MMSDEAVQNPAEHNETTQETSMMERIAAQFGETIGQPKRGLPAEEAPAEESAEPEHEDLEWEGQQYRLPKTLAARFMKDADYTHKTTELAEIRKGYELARESVERYNLDSQFHQSVAKELNQLNVIDTYLAEANKLNWSNMTTEQMFRTRAELDQVKEQRDTLKQAVQSKRAQYDDAVKKHRDDLRAKSKEAIAKSIPNYGEETEKEIRKAANSHGLTDSETDSVLLDPRSARILWKAAQFDKVQANVGKAGKEISRTLKTTPRGEPMPANTAAKLNFHKAMKNATNSGQKAQLIEARLAKGSIFNPKGH
jgi:hypothetical protein